MINLREPTDFSWHWKCTNVSLPEKQSYDDPIRHSLGLGQL